MDLAGLLREAIASGRLGEPFSAREASDAVAHAGWTPSRVQSWLVRYCQGNLAAAVVAVERVAHGRYRLLTDGPRGTASSRGRGRRFGRDRDTSGTLVKLDLDG
ncbi:MAG: hypothetical protein ACRD6R_13245 [Candidatus Polarisedimenticolia bacterium]